MKYLQRILIVLAMLTTFSLSAQVSINTDNSAPDGSAMLEVKSTEKGFLPPRMTQAQRDLITPVEGLVVFNTDTHQPNFYNGTEWRNFDGSSAKTLAIGDFHEGGVIFYLDGSGGGLVCAVSDQSNSAEWGCQGTPINGADGTAIGTGEQNTIDIEAGCTTAGTAADLCANLPLNGYDDWFLPSKDELNLMYQNKETINATAILNGGSGFATGISSWYWSSSEDDSVRAWIVRFSEVTIQFRGDKGFAANVRAVRAF
jgi:hypothetical protein